MKKLPLAAAGLLALTLMGTGCATGSQSASPFGDTLERQGQIRIDVRNLNWNEARLWALSAGRRIRLGSVGGNQDAVFNLDWDLTLPLAIQIDLVAGPSCTTREMRVDPGDHLELQIDGSSVGRAFCTGPDAGGAQSYRR